MTRPGSRTWCRESTDTWSSCSSTPQGSRSSGDSRSSRSIHRCWSPTQQEMLLAQRLAEQVSGRHTGRGARAPGPARIGPDAGCSIGKCRRTSSRRCCAPGRHRADDHLPLAGRPAWWWRRRCWQASGSWRGSVAYKIVDLSRVWIEGEVFEPDLPAVAVGQRVSAEFPALPGEVRSGQHQLRVSYARSRDQDRAGPRGDGQSGLRLKPGMYATFHFAARRQGPERPPVGGAGDRQADPGLRAGLGRGTGRRGRSPSGRVPTTGSRS